MPQTMEHGYVSDQSDFEQIIWEFEHKEEGQPLFLFNVTIQNHGSYTVKDYPAQVQLADEPGKYPMAEQYLTLANKTDQAFRPWWTTSPSATSPPSSSCSATTSPRWSRSSWTRPMGSPRIR